MNSEGTQPYIHMYPFFPKPSYPGWHITLSRVPCAITVGVVQSLSRFGLFATPWTGACLASLFLTIFQSLLKFMSIEWVMSSSHLILCCPLLLLSSNFPSIGVLFNESAVCIRWLKYWSFSISSSSEHSPLISFRID